MQIQIKTLELDTSKVFDVFEPALKFQIVTMPGTNWYGYYQRLLKNGSDINAAAKLISILCMSFSDDENTNFIETPQDALNIHQSLVGAMGENTGAEYFGYLALACSDVYGRHAKAMLGKFREQLTRLTTTENRAIPLN